MTPALSNTLWEPMYFVFKASSDSELMTHLTIIAVLYTLTVACYSASFPAPYGRYSIHHAKSIYRLSMNPRIAWSIQESPSFLVPLILAFSSPCLAVSHFANTVALTLFVFHYINRSVIYPYFRIASTASRCPIITVVAALAFSSFNGFYQGHHLLNVREKKLFDTFFALIGLIVFAAGMLMNIYHDNILAGLKGKATKESSRGTLENRDAQESPKRKPSGTDSGYQIPHGGLFYLVSCPNYLGEIMEWLALSLVTRSLPQFIFAVFSFLFLGLRAIHHHQFYHQVFQHKYPKQRRALVPLLL